MKRKSLIKIFLIIGVLSLAFVGAGREGVVAADPITYFCNSIQIQGATYDASSGKNLVRIPVDENFNPVPTTFNVTITVSGIETGPGIQNDGTSFDLSGYRLRYVDSDLSNTLFTTWKTSGALQFTRQEGVIHTATTTITIDSLDDWVYSLEYTDGSTARHTIANSGDEADSCDGGNGKTDKVVLGVSIVQPILVDFDKSCDQIPNSYRPLLNHFNCAEQNGIFSPITEYTSFTCREGYTYDVNRCNASSNLEYEVCMRCVPENDVAEIVKVSYGGFCDSNPVQGSSTIRVCEDTNFSGLICSPSTNPAHAGQSICVAPSQREAGESCFRGYNECSQGTFVSSENHNTMYCKLESPSAFSGVCDSYKNTTTCYTDADCINYFNGNGIYGAEGAKCTGVATSNEKYCVPGYGTSSLPNSGGGGSVDRPDPSTDFGSRNCPYAVGCDAESLSRAFPGETYKTVRENLLQLCQGDATKGIFKVDTSPAAKQGTDQYQEFLQCSRCISDRGTWTEAFGCIITTPEGIFTAIIRIALGVMGGVALIRITYLGIITAQSKDEGKIAEARKGVIATLAGVAVVVFAVLILRIIGVNILDIVPRGFFG